MWITPAKSFNSALGAFFRVLGVLEPIRLPRFLADDILSIKPFLVNDVVDIDGTTGTVEEIGLRTTRLRDFDGRVLTLPNSTIADAEIRNISEEPTRRIKTDVGLSYDTTPAELEAAIQLAEETVNAVEGVDTDQTRVLFWDYGDRAMELRLDYHVDALPDWKG